MPIKKQEFYEGAALHQLAREGSVRSLIYEAPFFVMNDRVRALLKYSTKVRSPWGFTFMPDEQRLLREHEGAGHLVVGLICGSDGVVALPLADYLQIAPPKDVAIHVSCYRRHGEHYEVNGPSGCLNGKIAPSMWRQILEE